METAEDKEEKKEEVEKNKNKEEVTEKKGDEVSIRQERGQRQKTIKGPLCKI